jgi:pSer/pThr/pTyr-binding forkhead associated (FHA) protein
MSSQEFERQLGPFVLVQRPPDTLKQQKALQLGAKRTVAIKRGAANDELSLIFEFDDLVVATLPPIDKGVPLNVGRMPDCDLVIDDASVSKHHANVAWDGTEAVVEDLKSSNGTRLNGDPLHMKMAVRDGDTLSFGDAQFCYLTTGTLHARLTTGKFKARG